MAFATSNVVRENFGSINVMRGNWSGTAGDDAGSIVGNGYALDAEFDTNSSTGPGGVVPARVSNSSGVWTVTVPFQQTVTNGSFKIEFR